MSRMQRKFKYPEAQALYDQALGIMETVKELVALIDEDNKMLSVIGQQMEGDSYMIPAKIIGAESGKLYDIRMENATLIRMHARDIKTGTNNFIGFGYKFNEYLTILNDQVDKFRDLFKIWVATFDPMCAIEDEWGLLNPPGMDFSQQNEYDLMDRMDEDEEEDNDLFLDDDDEDFD